jgi:hypothetical protein
MYKLANKKIFTLVTILIATMLLAACVRGVPRLAKFDPNSSLVQDHGIVIMNLKNVDYIDFAIYDHNYIYPEYSADAAIDPEDYILEQYRVTRNSRNFDRFGYPATIYALEPGLYYINYGYVDISGDMYYTKSPGLTADSKIMYGAFEVKNGDVLYLGDLSFSWARRDLFKMVSVSGNLERARKEIADSQYKALAPHIRQAKFYAGGSKISYDCTVSCDCKNKITMPDGAAYLCP